MNFVVTTDKGQQEVADLAALEQLLQADPRPATADIEFALRIPLEGVVRREDDGQPEQVLLTSGSLQRTFTRNTTRQPEGEIGVSCSPDGNEVPVRSVNINFRPIDDKLTDRGIVWVHPGCMARLTLTLKPDRFGESNESITSVIEAAMAAVNTKVVSHFAQ